MPALTLLRPAALEAIRRRIDLEVAAATGDAVLHARLVEARIDLLRPLELLAAAGVLAMSVLNDDHAAGQRLRLLLAATASVFEIDGAGGADVAAAVTRFAGLARTSGEVLSAARSSANEDDDQDTPCIPGVVDHGALVIAGCACLRAGASDGLGPALLGTLHGLALAAGPAEAVLRWDRLAGTDAGFVDFILAFAGVPGRPGLNLRALAALVLIDRCERERWRCLQQLFGDSNKSGLMEVMRGLDDWAATDATGITTVAALDQERWELLGTFPARTTKRKNKVIEERAVVVAGRRGITPPVVEASVLAWNEARIEVRIPGGLAGGWFGFTSRTRVDAANQVRATARTRLEALADQELRCLPGGIPVDTISDLVWPPAPAPGRGAEPPHLVAAVFDGGTWIDPAHPLHVVVTTAPATTPAWVWLEDAAGITPALATMATSAVPRIAVINGQATVPVPSALARPEVQLRVRLAADPTGAARDMRDLPPLRIGSSRRVMVVRPRLVDGDEATADRQVSRSELLTQLDTIAQRFGLGLAYQELPEIPDALAVVAAIAEAVVDVPALVGGRLADPTPDDPVIERLLVALATLAARTPGAEDACWLVVLPGRSAWSRQGVAAGAARIAVATLAGCAAVLREPLPIITPRPQSVLRLIARSPGRRRLLVEEALTEERRCALPVSTAADDPSADDPAADVEPQVAARRMLAAAPPRSRVSATHLPLDARFAAVQRDAGGRLLHVSRLVALGTERVVTALIPLRAATTSVEIVALAGDGGVHRDGSVQAEDAPPDLSDASVVARMAGDGERPVLTEAQVVDGHLRLRAGHSRGGSLILGLEARLAPPVLVGPVASPAVSETWCRLLRWRQACATCCRPPWHRFELRSVDANGAPGSLALRLAADDGWSSATLPIVGAPPQPSQHLRIRRLDDGRLLAETSDTTTATTPAWRVHRAVVAGISANAAPRRVNARVLRIPEDGEAIELVMGTGAQEVRERFGANADAAADEDGCTACGDDHGQHPD